MLKHKEFNVTGEYKFIDRTHNNKKLIDRLLKIASLFIVWAKLHFEKNFPINVEFLSRVYLFLFVSTIGPF